MKRALYICEILTCAVSAIFICLYMWAFNEPLFLGQLGYILSLAGYGISAVLLIKKLIEECRSYYSRFSVKEGIFSTFYALPVLSVVLMAVVVFFTDSISISTFSPLSIILALSVVLLFLSAVWFKGKSMYKLIGLFVVLTFLIVAASVLCGAVYRVPSPYGGVNPDLSKLTHAELQRREREEFFKAFGGAAQLCVIPTIFAFLLADKFSDEMIYENS